MSQKITMYPTGVSQPNRNQDSGLQGKCLKAVRRNGTSYTTRCDTQKDPKYHHEWSNAEEILNGKTIQCGRPSTHMCSHATYYGIGMSVTRICKAIVKDEKSVLPVSTVLNGEYGIEGCALSVPAIVGRNGIEDLVPISMSEEERDALDHSASVLKQNMADIDFEVRD